MQIFTIVTISSLSVFAFHSEDKNDLHKRYKKQDYQLMYCEKYEQAAYVKYTVNKSDVFGSNARENNFREDDAIVSGSASLADYKNSGYDRGHLKPAAVSKGTLTDMDESFLMSNMSPQLPVFNRQGWKDVETLIRNLLNTQDSIIVYTGPVLEGITEFIGPNQVGVPKYFYSAVLLGDSTKAFAYLCPHKKLEKPYSQYLVSIDSLEKVLKTDLYQGLSEKIERKK